MSLFTMLKRNAKLAVRGNRGKAILILLITLAVGVVLSVLEQFAIDLFVINPAFSNPTMEPAYNELRDIVNYAATAVTPVEGLIMGVFSLLTVLLVAPIELGQIHWYYQLVHGRSESLTEIFRFFETGKNYARSLWYYINLSVRALLWAVVFYAAPGGVLGVSLYFLDQSENGGIRSMAAIATVGLFLSAVLFLLATVFYAAYMNKYTLTPYLITEDDSVSVRAAIKTSIAYTKGFRFSLFWYQLSFIGWILLCVFIFPMLYVIPYFYTAYSMYARYIIEKNRYIPPNATKEFVVEEEAPPPHLAPPEEPEQHEQWPDK